MTERERSRERDLVMTPNEFAFISDETKGNINVYVGPHKTSLANTDQPVIFDPKIKRFIRCTLEEATQILSIAPEGWYIVLKNPAHDSTHPRTGALNNLPDLRIGRKVNIPGPVSFALWPGQMVKVLQGHHLRSNQYLLVRVYDEEAAKANWAKSVITPLKDEEEPILSAVDDLTMGKTIVIRGTDVSFYMPPTGVEVVADESEKYVREAVTLERLEYCILLDEDGNKRYISGPAVVFPEPTERFLTRKQQRKFRAIELNENTGLYLKVIAPYEENGRRYEVGEELFITGKEQMIYLPRPEHAVIKYGGARDRHHGVAIPAGEARYVLDRLSGKISLMRGPTIFLPDPRKEVIVRRVLDARMCALLFPGNREALEYNLALAAQGDGFVATQPPEPEAPKREEAKRRADAIEKAPSDSDDDDAFAGDDFTRKTQFTPPRSIVLDTRFQGAVAINVWTGYAVMVVRKDGRRSVVSGPHTHLLEYDETLQVIELSTGTPKTDEKLLRTVYLRVLNNKVSDIVSAETRDLCAVKLQLSYRVNFEGEPNKWFEVEDYVKFLTDHLRSLLRHAIKQQGVQNFYAHAAEIVRDVILGKMNEEGKRAGRFFAENGMRVYDVEVLDVTLGDAQIAKLLIGAQHAAVEQTLTLANEERKLELTRKSEGIAQEVVVIKAGTRAKEMAIEAAEIETKKAVALARIASDYETRARAHTGQLAEQEALDTIHKSQLARERQRHELDEAMQRHALERQLEQLRAEVASVVEKANAVSPDLIAALQSFGDRALAQKMAESMAPLAILGGESVSDVLARLLRGTPLAKLLAHPTNGDPAAAE
jgi:major vault protein